MDHDGAQAPELALRTPAPPPGRLELVHVVDVEQGLRRLALLVERNAGELVRGREARFPGDGLDGFNTHGRTPSTRGAQRVGPLSRISGRIEQSGPRPLTSPPSKLISITSMPRFSSCSRVRWLPGVAMMRPGRIGVTLQA